MTKPKTNNFPVQGFASEVLSTLPPGCHVIEIGEDGSVEAMQTDNFNLKFLGRQIIFRATEITFNDDTQLWDIVYIDHGGCDSLSMSYWVPEGKGIDGYDLARRIEVAWLNQCRIEDVQPTSQAGRYWLALVRDQITAKELTT